MTKLTSSLFVVTLLGMCLQGVSAQAQLSRTAVSAAKGNDANSCDLATPCRTFQRAHDATNDQGEITVLDPGGYGTLTITKSISVVNDGVGEAGMLVSSGGTGITVNAPNGAGYVNLRGITIQGIGFGGGTGLKFNTGFSLTITHCVIRNHTKDGIDFFPNGTSNLSVSDTLVADNGGTGILVAPSASGTVKAVFSRVEANNNSGNGIEVAGQNAGTIDATATDSVAANNNGIGFLVVTDGHPTSFMVVHSTSANNGTGLQAANGATMRVGHSTVTGNATGLSAPVLPNPGILLSFQDNDVAGNAPDGAFTGNIAHK